MAYFRKKPCMTLNLCVWNFRCFLWIVLKTNGDLEFFLSLSLCKFPFWAFCLNKESLRWKGLDWWLKTSIFSGEYSIQFPSDMCQFQRKSIPRPCLRSHKEKRRKPTYHERPQIADVLFWGFVHTGPEKFRKKNTTGLPIFGLIWRVNVRNTRLSAHFSFGVRSPLLRWMTNNVFLKNFTWSSVLWQSEESQLL